MPFLKSVKMPLSSCSLSLGQVVLLKYASNTLHLRKFSRALLMKKTVSNFDIEIKRIVNKYTAAGFSGRFVRSIIDNFGSGKDNLIRPQWLLGERKAFTIHLPFSPSNESFVKTFISKLNYFINEKCKFNAAWNTRKIQSLFPLKDKVDHYSCVIYRGDCSCDQIYGRQTIYNAKIR